jgi:hypothetical protein
MYLDLSDRRIILVFRSGFCGILAERQRSFEEHGDVLFGIKLKDSQICLRWDVSGMRGLNATGVGGAIKARGK